MADCGDLLTNQDLSNSKKDATTINDYVESDQYSIVSKNGKVIRTLEGTRQDAQDAIDSFKRTNKGDYSSGPLTLEDGFEYTSYTGDGKDYFAVFPPYTTDPVTYPDPSLDPNLTSLSYVLRSEAVNFDNDRQKEITGISDITEASIGLDLFPLIGQGLRVAGVGLWIVPSVTADGSPIPNPANLDAVPTDNNVTINGGTDVVLVTAIKNNTISLSQCGAIPNADSTDAINFAFNLGVVVDVDDDYLFTSITMPADVRTKGLGILTGLVSNGAKPDYATLKATDAAGRLALLQSYNQNSVTITGSGNFRGSLIIENALVSGADLFVRGNLELINCSTTSSLQTNAEGTIIFDDGIIVDCPEDAVFCQRGGTYHFESGIIISPAKRGFNVQQGIVYANDAQVGEATMEAAFATIGGKIFAKRLLAEDGGAIGILALYGASIEIESCNINNNAGAACVSESNSAIYAEFGSFTNCNKGLSTSYNGFIQARGGTITGNNGLAVDGLTGGYINVEGATIDNTNNGGGQQIRAKDLCFVIAEEPGTPGSGKDTLTTDQYNPPYNVISNGMSLITDSENDFTEYPANETGISFSREIVMRRTTVNIAAGAIEPVTTWTIVNPESGTADNLDNINRSSSRRVDRVTIQSDSSANTITIRHNQGNIRTRDGVDIVLTGTAQIVNFEWNDKLGVWSQPQ